ncbi:sigma-70 family RNA polymerase sigma factor [Streptomyces bobili]|uniref:sigma-70 family RNA polymerase sigma factor n=1 Tax=Streptomyces bobili TaxID=67280 RepID=UPI0033AA7FA9
MARCPAGPEREALREGAVQAFLPVARRLARRYGSPIDHRDDLYQVACLGLLHAIDRFDPDRGHAFLSFAVPTIDGELKRHLRDHTWHVHVPRTIQDQHRRVRQAQEELRRAGYADGGTLGDLHRLTGLPEQDIRLVLRAERARNPASIDERRGAQHSVALADRMGGEDPALERITDQVAVAALLASLPERERRILHLYFFRGMTQRQIADRIGISQMHVSRLINRACTSLRRRLTC